MTRPEEAETPEDHDDTSDEGESPPPTESAPPKTVSVRTSDFKRIKDEARQKGYTQARQEFDRLLEELRTEMRGEIEALRAERAAPAVDEATTDQPAETEIDPPAVEVSEADIEVEAAEPPLEEDDMPQPPNPKPRTPPAPPTGRASTTPSKSPAETRIERENARLRESADRMRRAWRDEEKKRRHMQRRLEAKDAEMALREELYGLGVKDVDYGLRLLTRELEGRSAQELQEYDRKAYFERLRQERPYLFGETVRPATTGTAGAAGNGGAAPATPAAGAPSREAADSQRFDARKAKPEEVAERIRGLGLNPQM